MTDFGGVQIVTSPHMRDGDIMFAADWAMYGRAVAVMYVGVRPLTTHEKALRAARNEARAIVREGLADVLEWLGMTVEDEQSGHDLIATMQAHYTPAVDPRGFVTIRGVTT